MNVGSVRARPAFERETTSDDDRKPVSDFSALVIAIADGHEPKKQPKEPANIEGLFSSGSNVSPASPETERRGDGETGNSEASEKAISSPLPRMREGKGEGTATRVSEDARFVERPAPDPREGPITRKSEEAQPVEQPAPDPNLAIALARLLDRATVPSSKATSSNHADGAKRDAPLPPPPRLPHVKPAIEAKSELASHRDFTPASAEQPSEPKLPLPTSGKSIDVSLPAVLVSESELAPRPSQEPLPSSPRLQRPLEVSSAPAFEARTSSDGRSSEERELDQGSPDGSTEAERNLSEVVAADTRTVAISPVRPAPQASPFAVAVNVATQLVGQGSSAGTVVGFAQLASEIERLGSLSASAEGSSADFELEHPELGKVRVALSVKGAEIALRIFAPDAATAMRLSANDANLRRALASAGLKVTGLRVDVDGRPANKEQRVRRRRGLDMEA